MNAGIACAASPGTHDPVVYPVAVLTPSRNAAAARAFATYLAGPEARAIFESHGFTAVAR
jgi:molybdate transport system substrate-binding protein